MRLIKTTFFLLSILSSLVFTMPALAASSTTPLSCNPNNGWCYGILGISSGLGETDMFDFSSQSTNGNCQITNLPPQVTPPAPTHAHTMYSGRIAVDGYVNASCNVVYKVDDVKGNTQTTVSVCTYNLSASNGSLTASGSCTNGNATVATVAPDPTYAFTMDLGAN